MLAFIVTFTLVCIPFSSTIQRWRWTILQFPFDHISLLPQPSKIPITMAINPFILLPLYMYPEAGVWDPLFTAASAHHSVDFQVIINPWTGPGEGSCPDDAFTAAMQQIQSYSNIKTLGYVHTANRWDCGKSGSDICSTSAPIEELKANVTTYQHWGSKECGNLAVDGIFFDEAPSTSKSEYIDYMREASIFAKETLTHGGKTVLFNAGTSVTKQYWNLADYICVLENSGEAYESVSDDVGELDAGGKYSDQATFILYDYQREGAQMKKNIQSIVGKGIGGLSMTDTNGYVSWSNNWMDFVAAFDEVANGRQ